MIRTTLIAFAALATIAAASPALAQAGAPVRTLGPADAVAGPTVAISAQKASPCADKSCASRPLKRDAYVLPAQLGW